jgi:hypothetical protein
MRRNGRQRCKPCCCRTRRADDVRQIGVMRALHRHDVREFTDRKETHWRKRKLKRDE